MSNVETLIKVATKFEHPFFHFTDTRNLPSIREHGLLSMRTMRAEGIEPVTGGNQWSLDADQHFGMDAYVHLCFMWDHPMEYRAKEERRILESKFLRIKPEIISTAGALISTEVANKSGATRGAAEDMIPLLDAEVIYKRLNWKDAEVQQRLRTAKLYELLIPDRIPPEYIVGL